MPVLETDLIPNPIDRIISADQWKPPADIRLISADDHLLEADHLFEERLPKKFKARAPKLWRDVETGHVHVEIDGKSFDPPGIGTIGHECPGFWDAGERLKAMDSEGIKASVLYHGQAQALNYLIATDPELYFACMDVYNEWMAEYTAPHRDRLVGMAILPSFLKPETAAKLAQVRFHDRPQYTISARGSSPGIDTLSASGEVRIGRTTYRGVEARKANARFRYNSRILNFDSFELTRAEGSGSGSVVAW